MGLLRHVSRHRSTSRSRPRHRLRLEPLEPRLLLAGVPYGAHQQDTGEFMLGDVVATVVLFESNGSIDPNTEDWNQLVRDDNGNVVFDSSGRTISVSGPNWIEETKDRVKEGLTWWQDTLANFGSWQDPPTPTPVHSLNFIYDFQYTHNPIDTGYEPISRRSNDYVYWVEDFLKTVGYDTPNSLDVDIRAFNDAQREKYDADWAYTIFVVNDHNDPDGRFAPGGSFQRAFAFAGGRFFVSPSLRPPSTFAHETGHMFWAKDEYAGGASYTDRRGYYDTQNWNAADNPTPGFHQQDSLMASGTLLDNAWDRHVSSESSLAMIGWQDSDADGVFDVLDVPLSLTGSGYYDAAQGTYRFIGHSEVQTLPNRNPSGLQNDITINEVSLAEYSLDNGATWHVAHEYHTYAADLNLTIPIQPNQDILIRTRSVDPGTGLTVTTSDSVFHGDTQLPTAVEQSGIHGFVWHDVDADQNWDVGESGLYDWTLQLVDDQGAPLDLKHVLEPDDYSEGQEINHAVTGMTLSALGYGTADERVGAVTASTAATGQRVLAYVRAGTFRSWGTEWNADSRKLRIDFDTPVAMVSLDAISPGYEAYGRLDAYDADNHLLARYTTGRLTGHAVETMALVRATPDIAYVIAGATKDTAVRLDNLQVGPDSTTTTDSLGHYALRGLPAGVYHVQAVPPAHWLVTTPATGTQDVVILADGSMQTDSGTVRKGDFGGVRDASAFPWQNPANPVDVDGSGSVVPLDALLVINELNTNGSRELPDPGPGNEPPPYFDVNGDNHVSPIDALLVINYLNARSGNGSGEAPAAAFGNSGGDAAEGEPWTFSAVMDLPQQGNIEDSPPSPAAFATSAAIGWNLPTPKTISPFTEEAFSTHFATADESLVGYRIDAMIGNDLWEVTAPARLNSKMFSQNQTTWQEFEQELPKYPQRASTVLLFASPQAADTTSSQRSRLAAAKNRAYAEQLADDSLSKLDRWLPEEMLETLANDITERQSACPHLPADYMHDNNVRKPQSKYANTHSTKN